MKSILFRVASFALTFCFLLGCVSCASKPAPIETAPVDRIALTVETPPAVYPEELREHYAARMTEIVAEVVRLTEGLILKDAEKQALTETVRRGLIPMLAAIPIYPEEIEAVLTSAERTLAESGETDAWSLWIVFYQRNLPLFGSTRAGKLGYAAIAVWLASREQSCRDRYEKYGYAWYLDDAEHYASMQDRLASVLGEDGFCAAAEILTFAASSVAGGVSAWGDDLGYGLSAGELTAILSRQSSRFFELSLTTDQWSLVGELLEEAAPKRRNTPIKAELGVLADEGYFARAACVMPSLLSLYRAAATRMTAADTQAIAFGDDETARIHTVCRLLVECDSELSALLTAVETHAATESEKEKKILSQLGVLADCQAFLDAAGEADADALRASIAACAEAPTDARAEAVRAALNAYLATKAPYLYYVLSGVGKETAHAASKQSA